LSAWKDFCTLGSLAAANCAVGQLEGTDDGAGAGVWATADIATRHSSRKQEAVRILRSILPFDKAVSHSERTESSFSGKIVAQTQQFAA
jgi:hypothetical protein